MAGQLLVIALVVLVAQAGHVCVHVWAREDHTHYAHKPWIEGLNVANWMHVASFCSNWPPTIGLLYFATQTTSWQAGLLYYMAVACASKVLWQWLKRRLGKDWPSWEKQLEDYIKEE